MPKSWKFFDCRYSWFGQVQILYSGHCKGQVEVWLSDIDDDRGCADDEVVKVVEELNDKNFCFNIFSAKDKSYKTLWDKMSSLMGKVLKYCCGHLNCLQTVNVQYNYSNFHVFKKWPMSLQMSALNSSHWHKNVPKLFTIFLTSSLIFRRLTVLLKLTRFMENHCKARSLVLDKWPTAASLLTTKRPFSKLLVRCITTSDISG